MVFINDGSLLSLSSRWVEVSSGLKINFSKSAVFVFNRTDILHDETALLLNCKIGRLPFKYLGILVGLGTYDRRIWNPVIEKLLFKLSDWKSKRLSIAGRATLINAVLNAIPTFLLSFYHSPKHIIKTLTNIQRRFL
ncbi:hypothetical protein ACS0TY_018850 [Phlomoides rotata]